MKNHLWSDLPRKRLFLLMVEIDEPTSEAHSAHEPVELVGVSRKSAKIGSPGRTRTCDLVINSGGAARRRPSRFSRTCDATI